MDNRTLDQLRAQKQAKRQARYTRKPIDDGYGTRWYPPGTDGVPIVGPTPIGTALAKMTASSAMDELMALIRSIQRDEYVRGWNDAIAAVKNAMPVADEQERP